MNETDDQLSIIKRKLSHTGEHIKTGYMSMAKHGSLILAFIIALSGVITSYAVNTERTKNNAEASANNRGEIESVKAQMVTREILQLHVEPIKTDIGEIKEVNKRLLKYLENQKDGPQ